MNHSNYYRSNTMGQVISNFIEESEKRNEAQVVEPLQLLQKLVSAKLEAQAAKLEAEAFEDKSLPIVATVKKVETYLVKVETAPSEDIKKSMEDIFQGEFLDGFQHLVTAAVNELLGNTLAGEKEFSSFQVVFANNSLLRIDFYIYKYDFSSEGLREKIQNAFCYVVQVGVLDLKKVDPQVVLYELDKSIGTVNIPDAIAKIKEEVKFMEELYKVIDHLGEATIMTHLKQLPASE